MRALLLAGLATFALGVMADDFSDGTSQGYEFANGQSGYVQGLAGGTDGRASSYGGTTQVTEQTHPCNQANAQGQKTCGGQTASPGDNPTQYYGMSRAELEDAARVKASTDSDAKYVLGAHDKRPQYDIKPEDPLFKYSAENQQSMVALTDTYSGCKDIKYGSGGAAETKTCTKTGYRTNIDNTCRRTYGGTCNWVSAHKFEVYHQDCARFGQCSYSAVSTVKKQESLEYYNSGNGIMSSRAATTYVHHDIGDKGVGNTKWIVKLSSLTDKTALFVQYVRWVADVDSKPAYYPTLTINGVNVPRAAKHWGIAKKTYRFVGAFSGIKQYLKEGENIIVLNTFGGTMEINKAANLQEVMECEQKYSSNLMCSEGGISGATYVSTTCIDSKDRVIDGVTFHRDCWVQDEVYRRPGPPAYTEEPLCDELRSKGCGTASENCTKWHPDGWCQAATLSMTCSTGPAQTMQVCGDSLVCSDGKCYDSYAKAEPNNTKDFMNAASYLAAMEDMKKEFDPNNVTVWKGQFRTCKVKDSAIGGDRCCTGGTGFLSTVGGGCDANEEAIAKAKEDKRVTFVRSRTVCEQRIAGSCVLEVTYMDFCTWPSKLARIVQDQGRPQMGQTVDNPCPGFKLQNPNEFQMINWDLIDLSDYFSDVQTKYNSTAKPDGQELKSQQQQSNDAVNDEYAKKYQQYYGN